MNKTPDDQAQSCYNLLGVPKPSLEGLDCLQYQLAFWPYGFLHVETCDKSGEKIITIHDKSRFPLYKRDYWYSEEWERPSMEIDWERPFLNQLYELQCKTPHFHFLGYKNENCDYGEDIWFSKNCYMSRHIGNSEDILYSYRMVNDKECCDCTYCYDMEFCYFCTYCQDSFHLYYSLYSNNCSDSYFLYDCKNCHNCVMCWNLRNKQYFIRNKQYTKKEYETEIQNMKLDSRKSLMQLQEEYLAILKNEAIHKTNRNNNTENCTGNHLSNCKNIHKGYFWENSEDCANVCRGTENKDIYNSVGMYKCELSNLCCQTTEMYHVSHALYSGNCTYSYFIDQCIDSKHLFGCVGMYKKEYCILNKQYSNEEYEELVPRLMKKLEEENALDKYLPMKFAYGSYNQSLGAFFFKETKESAENKGLRWKEDDSEKATEGIPADTLPNTAEEVSKDVLGKTYSCSLTNRSFKFIEQEIEFYKKLNLPLPEHYSELRQLQRYQLIPPVMERESSCSKCNAQIVTFYPEYWEYKNIVCDDCYKKIIY